MASLRHENDRGRSGWRLQFRDIEKRKRSVWLGDLSEDAATKTKKHVEHLLATRKEKDPPAPATTEWLATIDGGLREKLARCGLVESVEKRDVRSLTLVGWVDEYIDERQDVKKATKDRFP